MKITYAVLAFLVAMTGLRAQTPPLQDILFTTSDTTKGKVLPRRMIATLDGGFITAGSDGKNGYLLRTNNCGQVIWTRQYLIGDETDLNSVAELPTGEIIAAGACLHCDSADLQLKALIIKTDSEGNLLRDTTLGNAGFASQAFDVVVTSSGNVAVTGYVDFAGYFGPSDAFLAVMDHQFSTTIWKQYHHFYRDAGNALTQTADGGFAIAGRSVPGFSAPWQAQIFRTDAAGSLVWKYTSSYLNTEFKCVRQAGDGSIVTLSDRIADTIAGREVWLTVHDINTGALVQEKLYGSAANDAGRSLERVQGGYLIGAVYGQPSQSYWSSRDWIFRLDEQFEPADQYFRDSYLFGHSLVNAIPLSADGKAFAYHSVMNLYNCFCPSLLFFKRTFRGERAVLTQAPEHYQLMPRNLTTNKGIVKYTGTIAGNNYDEIRLDVLRNGELQTSLSDDSPQSFEFVVEINAELAFFNFRLYGLKDQVQITEAEACEVVAGDAYLIQGQSNAVAALPFLDTANVIDHAYRHHTSPFIRNFGLKFEDDTLFVWRKDTGKRYDYADNISGQWGLVLGKKIVDTYGVPVAILNGAISGISIDNMMPDSFDHANLGTSYGRFLRKVERSGLKDHIRGKMMFQGETNAAGNIWDSANKYYQKFTTLDNAWKQDYPAVQNGYLFQIRPGGYGLGATLLTCLQVEEAQRRIAETLPEWKIMSTTGMNHDSLHYHYPNGFERAGNDIFRLLANDLYGSQDTLNIHPPTVGSIRFSDCDSTEIALQMRYTNDVCFWTPGWESDFILEGGNDDVSVTGGAIIDNTVYLTLSGPPGPGFTGLSYASHPGGDSAPVKNANGIGMLTFFNQPVAPYDLFVTASATDTKCHDSADGIAFATPEGGTAGFAFNWSSGSTEQIAAGLPAGAYEVTVTDAKGCTAIGQTMVQSPDPIYLEDTIIVSATGAANGSLGVAPGGGIPPYAYLWSTGNTTSTIEGLAAGTYTVTVTDVNHCAQSFVLELPMTIGTFTAYTYLEKELFPNPCGMYLYLLLPGAPDDAVFQTVVSDITGREMAVPVFRIGPLTKIETKTLPAGTYILTISGNGVRYRNYIFIKN